MFLHINHKIREPGFEPADSSIAYLSFSIISAWSSSAIQDKLLVSRTETLSGEERIYPYTIIAIIFHMMYGIFPAFSMYMSCGSFDQPRPAASFA